MTRAGLAAFALAAGLLLLAPAPLDAQAAKPRRRVGDVLRAVDRVAEERERRRDASRYDDHFQKYTKRYFGPAADWRWFKAQGMAESDLTPTARSRVGARGIMQLMPSTFAAIASQSPAFRRIDDPEWNIAAGIAHDRYLWRLFDGRVHDDERWEFMFGSYNAGQGTIMRAQRTAEGERMDRACWKSVEAVAPRVGRWRYPETLGYVKKIRENRAKLGER